MASSAEQGGAMRTRQASISNRFEIEKVDEQSHIAMIDDCEEDSKSQQQQQQQPVVADSTIKQLQANANMPPHSSLKKTVKHYNYDDNYFDFGTANTTAQAKAATAAASSGGGKASEKEPMLQRNVSDAATDDDDDAGTEATGNEENAAAAASGCFQVNYNARNQPTSIICNLNSNGVESYRNCFHDIKTITLYQKIVAEFVGTFVLTLYACSIGLPIGDGEKQVPSLNGCLGGGLTLATLVWCLGSVSGGHLNPAVSIAFLFTGKINALIALIYVGAQLSGAMAGAYLLNSLVPESLLAVEGGAALGVTRVHADVQLAQAVGIELVITFILVLTIFSCVDARRNDLTGSFPLQIGFAVVVGGLFGGQFTGGSMNPARSFGPALVAGKWHEHWVYWLGPIAGGVLAGLVYEFGLTLKCPRTTTALPTSTSSVKKSSSQQSRQSH